MDGILDKNENIEPIIFLVKIPLHFVVITHVETLICLKNVSVKYLSEKISKKYRELTRNCVKCF